MTTTATTSIPVPTEGMIRESVASLGHLVRGFPHSSSPDRRHALGRCDLHGAVAWRTSAGVTTALGTMRCPQCGGLLSTTTRMLRAGFRVIPDHVRDEVAGVCAARELHRATARFMDLRRRLDAVARHPEAELVDAYTDRMQWDSEHLLKSMDKLSKLTKRTAGADAQRAVVEAVNLAHRDLTEAEGLRELLELLGKVRRSFESDVAWREKKLRELGAAAPAYVTDPLPEFRERLAAVEAAREAVAGRLAQELGLATCVCGGHSIVSRSPEGGWRCGEGGTCEQDAELRRLNR